MIEIDFIDLLDRFNLALKKRTLQRSVRGRTEFCKHRTGHDI